LSSGIIVDDVTMSTRRLAAVQSTTPTKVNCLDAMPNTFFDSATCGLLPGTTPPATTHFKYSQRLTRKSSNFFVDIVARSGKATRPGRAYCESRLMICEILLLEKNATDEKGIQHQQQQRELIAGKVSRDRAKPRGRA